MSFGCVMTIVFKIVTVVVGAVLAVRPCPMRWEKWWAKGIFAVFMFLGVALRVGNTFFAKSSVVENIVGAAYLFVLLALFFKINLWKLAVQNFMYWFHLTMMEHFVVYLICFLENATFAQYNINSKPNAFLPWSGLHIFIEVLLTAGLLAAAWGLRRRSFVPCQKRRTYIYLSLILILEWLIFENIIYNGKYVYALAERTYILLLLFFLITLLVVSAVCILINAYTDVRRQERMEAMNSRIVSEQYASLKGMYQSKRQQFHDMRNHFIVLKGYLQSGEPERAKAYVENLLEDTSSSQSANYTGVSVMDFMLDYKMTQAKAREITVHLSLDVHQCPVSDSDFCVILGNLMDNAIEAAAVLEQSRRHIHLAMKMTGNMFLMEISNPYVGKRRRIDGRYETTKKDRDNHGLGLASVKNIVEARDGILDIDDDGKCFTVVVTLFSSGE